MPLPFAKDKLRLRRTCAPQPPELLVFPLPAYVYVRQEGQEWRQPRRCWQAPQERTQGVRCSASLQAAQEESPEEAQEADPADTCSQQIDSGLRKSDGSWRECVSLSYMSQPLGVFQHHSLVLRPEEVGKYTVPLSVIDPPPPPRARMY